jgi:nucleoside phosphorylase
MQADVLIVTALPLEHTAAVEAFAAIGVALKPQDQKTALPYLTGTMTTPGRTLSVSLARPTRMGATATAPIAAGLAERLKPQCIAMCGVCAGNPSDVALGDVIIAECAYTYDEGKRTVSGFEGDHRQIPLPDKWLRTAQDLNPNGLPTFGAASKEAGRIWLLEQLNINSDPRAHPARARYLGGERWTKVVTEFEEEGLIQRSGKTFTITERGHAEVEALQAYHLDPPSVLPFKIHVGPMASGNVVVKDGVTWDILKMLGVRTVLGLEMEAASIAQVAQRLAVPYWVVVKGVMDYADPKKDDRIKPFAARASADVLLRLLQSVPLEPAPASERPAASSTNVIGDVTGSNIKINQNVGLPQRRRALARRSRRATC